MTPAENGLPESAELPVGLPHDWVQRRDLPCPVCGYNLRMLHTPRCPECGGVFRWQALLHVTRPRCDAPLANENGELCPRCELPLNWKLLLGSAEGIDPRHYEYTNRPLDQVLAPHVTRQRVQFRERSPSRQYHAPAVHPCTAAAVHRLPGAAPPARSDRAPACRPPASSETPWCAPWR